MRITMSTTPQDVAQRTKSVMERDVIPNMLLKNAGKPNGFVSEKKDYQYWVRRVCGRTKQAQVFVLILTKTYAYSNMRKDE